MTHLTERQYEVWRYAALGLTNRQIADRLQISPKTVDHHRAAIMAFLKVQCVADLTRRAIEHGVIEISLRPLLIDRSGDRTRYLLPVQ